MRCEVIKPLGTYILKEVLPSYKKRPQAHNFFTLIVLTPGRGGLVLKYLPGRNMWKGRQNTNERRELRRSERVKPAGACGRSPRKFLKIRV